VARPKREKNPLGIYRTVVPPFADLRETEPIPTKSGRVRGKHGLDPMFATNVETVADHILHIRKTVIAVAGNPRIGTTWRQTIQQLLKGSTPAGQSFTAPQLCDLFDFATQDTFWRQHVPDPNGLLRHGHKLWLNPDYISWSIKNDRPTGNRPESNSSNHPIPKGGLAADYAQNYDSWDTDWNVNQG